MVILDLYLPGTERLGFEAGLCGTLPLIAGHGHGRDRHDFPLPDGFFVDPHDLPAVRNSVLRALDGYEQMAEQVG